MTALARSAWRRFAGSLAILSLLIAAALLAWLERWAWRDAIIPHIELVRRVPVEAVVLGQRIDEVGVGSQVTLYPRVLYRYDFAGESFESIVIRHPGFVQSNGGDDAGGEVRFYGRDRHERAQEFLKQYPTGQKVTAWVHPAEPRETMLVRQELDISPFLWGLIPGLFVPFLWMFFASVLSTLVGSPQGRLVAFGWAILALASLGPLFWEYRQLLDPAGPTPFTRLQDIGLGLAGVVLVASLLPRQFRRGLFIGLVLCFTILGAIGTAGAAFIGSSQQFFHGETDSINVLVRFLEYALVSGVLLGLLVGLGAWRGVVTIRVAGEKEGRKGVGSL